VETEQPWLVGALNDGLGERDAIPEGRKMKVSRSALVVTAAVVTVVFGAVGAYLFSRPDSCRGLSREFGGCDPNLAPYTATTCIGIAKEWGQFVEQAGMRVVNDGPPGSGRAAQVTSERWTITQLANFHLRDLGLIADCDADEFYAAGSEEFSEEFREMAPRYLFDVQFEGEDAITSEQWEEDVKKAVAMIDQNEDQPAPPP
jgi:hypothetical protein